MPSALDIALRGSGLAARIMSACRRSSRRARPCRRSGWALLAFALTILAWGRLRAGRAG